MSEIDPEKQGKAMNISWKDFVKFIQQITDLSDQFHDGWHVCGRLDVENDAFIYKKVQKCYNKIKKEGGEFLVTYEYHVAYNASYEVPVLCFNAWKTDGSLITIDECWEYFGISESLDKYTILTQMDHPILLTPFYTLHPCKTLELLQLSFENSKNPLVSWLSTVAPTVHLLLPNMYAQLT